MEFFQWSLISRFQQPVSTQDLCFSRRELCNMAWHLALVVAPQLQMHLSNACQVSECFQCLLGNLGQVLSALRLVEPTCILCVGV